MQPLRFAELDHTASGTRDFAIRRRLPTVPQMLVIFVVALVIAVGLTVGLLNQTAVFLSLLLLFSIVGTYVVMQLQQSRDLVLATEFQNAMFASALGGNNKFCVIIRPDGNIIYVDRPFQTAFPDFMQERHRTLAGLLDHSRAAPQDREKIFAAIGSGVYDKVVFDMHLPGGQAWRIVMSIEPILRPSGFILLRGREFIERGASGKEPAAPQAPLLSRSNISLFAYVMDTMNTGVYMTDPTGNLIYANPTLEQWLAYRGGEIDSGSFALRDILHVQRDGAPKAAIKLEDFEGEVTLQKKAGGLVKAFANQKVIRGDEGKVLGCVALLQYVSGTDADAKKKVW